MAMPKGALYYITTLNHSVILTNPAIDDILSCNTRGKHGY
jgi:hypothetical protein